MFIWNRVELLTTLSMEYYLRARALLQQNAEQTDSRSGRCKKRRDAAASDGAIPYLCA